jgi:phosphoenolpyruvate carboxykinase (ATP)
MKNKTDLIAQLEKLGIKNLRDIYYNLNTPSLYEKAISHNEGLLSHKGPLVVSTGVHKARSPQDRFIVKEPETQNLVAWGDSNKPISEQHFDILYAKMLAYSQNKKLYIQDTFAGTDAQFRLPLRVITETAWHSIFVRNMFVLPKNREELFFHQPTFHVLHLPNLQAEPDFDGTHSSAFIIIHLSKRLVLIGGTSYAGEIKKSVFSLLNFVLPQKNALPMQCSANIGKKGDVAIMFGLSGAGKTTLSADANRKLIGDDEHGWTEDGVFNFEGGCYAKVNHLSKEAEPYIYEATRKFGTVLENVGIDNETRRVNLYDNSLTDNIRASYPISSIPNHEPDGMAGHPTHLVMLVSDAFGVIPPISKLSPQQAMYYFLSGFSARVSKTERGISEPVAIFSACFGEPFMIMEPVLYAQILLKKIEQHNVQCWLINTGWSGGPAGIGNRIKIMYTRAMLNAAIEGRLNEADTLRNDVFNLDVPTKIEGVPEKLLQPENCWNNKDTYNIQAQRLAALFVKNFKKFEEKTGREILMAGPNLKIE